MRSITWAEEVKKWQFNPISVAKRWPKYIYISKIENKIDILMKFIANVNLLRNEKTAISQSPVYSLFTLSFIKQ